MGKVQVVAQAASGSKECSHLKGKEKEWCEGYVKQCEKPDPVASQELGYDVYTLWSESGTQFEYEEKGDCRRFSSRAALMWGAPQTKGKSLSARPSGAGKGPSFKGDVGAPKFKEILSMKCYRSENRNLCFFRASDEEGVVGDYNVKSKKLTAEFLKFKASVKKEKDQAKAKEMESKFFEKALTMVIEELKKDF